MCHTLPTTSLNQCHDWHVHVGHDSPTQAKSDGHEFNWETMDVSHTANHLSFGPFLSETDWMVSLSLSLSFSLSLPLSLSLLLIVFCCLSLCFFLSFFLSFSLSLSLCLYVSLSFTLALSLSFSLTFSLSLPLLLPLLLSIPPSLSFPPSLSHSFFPSLPFSRISPSFVWNVTAIL